MDSPRYEEVQQWLNKSQRDLKVAWVLFNHEESLLDSVVYHCQQSAEKALKAYLTYQNVEFRKTHDLDVLVDLCALSEPSFKDFKDGADSLTPYATEFRCRWQIDFIKNSKLYQRTNFRKNFDVLKSLNFN